MRHLAEDLPLPLRDALALHEWTRLRCDASAAPLLPEDTTLQSLEDASLPDRQLAPTTSFFEDLILKPRAPDYRSPDDRFALLHNSDDTQAAPRHAQARRGKASRPGDKAVRACRAHVEDALVELLDAGRDVADDIAAPVKLGRRHEMQHREVLVTDLLHGLSVNRLLPIDAEPKPLPVASEGPLSFTRHEGGLVEVGHIGSGFAYDCEGPSHRIWLDPCEIADRPVTSCDWTLAMEDDGDVGSRPWLTEDHAIPAREGWDAPLSWWRQDDKWWTETLRGPHPVSLEAQVCYASYYEAGYYEAGDFDRWSPAHLPTEAEHEVAFRSVPLAGKFLDDGKRLGLLRPKPGAGIWGDAWEWTASRGFTAPEGPLGEYEGTSMKGQMVPREISCVIPSEQMPPTSCSVSDPHQSLQMRGLRLSRNVT